MIAKLAFTNNIKTSFFLFLFFSINSIAQTNNSSQQFLPNIIPPSPSAYNLGNYGNVPIGMFTGAPSLNIPLYSYNTANLEVPINMFYGSNGIKVDEISSNVGQGWNLTCGGVISRAVRDQPDENQNYSPVTIDENSTNEQRLLFFEHITMSETVDSEADLYSFNFGAYSGKFIYDIDNKSLVLMPAQNIKIEKVMDPSSFSFIITTPDGVVYYFNNKEITHYKKGGGNSVPMIVPTAWYLTKIVHPKGDEVYFNYLTANDDYISSNSQTLKLHYPGYRIDYCGNYVFYPPKKSLVTEHLISIKGQALASITSNNDFDGIIAFNYFSNHSADVVTGNKKLNEIVVKKNNLDIIDKINFSYTTTSNNRVFLDEIQYNDPSKKYQFEYIDKNRFPARLSFSQDHWGYYNGKRNSNIVPNKTGSSYDSVEYGGADKVPDSAFAKIGMLKKIVYPTKGSTVFEYEANDYYGTKEIIPKKTKASASIYPTGPSRSEVAITSLTKQEIIIAGALQFHDQCSNGDHGKSLANVYVKNTATNINEPFYTKNPLGGQNPSNGTSMQLRTNYSPEGYYFNAQPNTTYLISIELSNFSKLPSNHACTTATVHVEYLPSAAYTIQTNVITGGMRVKNTKDFPSVNGVPVYKRYHYAAQSDLSKSSGQLGKLPLYLDDVTEMESCVFYGSGGAWDVDEIVDFTYITSSSSTSLFDNGDSNVFYPYVTVSSGNDTFINGGEEHTFLYNRGSSNQIYGKHSIRSSPSDYGFIINGLPKAVSYFNTNGTLLSKTTNEYENILFKKSNSYAARKYYEPGVYSGGGEINIGVVEYTNSSYWNYLKSKQEIQYDLQGLNPLTTTSTFNYNNPSHLLLSSQEITNSVQGTIKTKYFYPQDPEMRTKPVVANLINKNMTANPLVVQTFNGDKKLSEKETQFALFTNLLLPESVYSGKDATTEKRVTFNQYDTKGNLQQYTLENGNTVSIIWGYNQSKPIAKIENAAYSALSGYVTNLQHLSNTGTEADLILALENLRINFPAAMITTYTYLPLVGISTITDPKGYTMSYTYDTYGRLEYVKDARGNLLSQNQYHYKN